MCLSLLINAFDYSIVSAVTPHMQQLHPLLKVRMNSISLCKDSCQCQHACFSHAGRTGCLVCPFNAHNLL